MAAASKIFYATGRRKTSSARVFLKPGSGKIEINGKAPEVYLTTPATQASVRDPFEAIEAKGQFDATITVKGGGPSGQAGAIRHALSRALVAFAEEHRAALKKAGFLKRDAREVERKKYGLHGARRRPQFSKR